MIKYDVLLCSIVFCDCYLNNIWQAEEMQLEIVKILKNHRLVLSHNLLNIYKELAKEKGLSLLYDNFILWYTTQAGLAAGKDKVVYIDDKDKLEKKDIDKILSIIVKDKLIRKPIIICGFCKNYISFYNSMRDVNIMNSSTVCDQLIDNRLRRNVLPFSVETKDDDNIQPYLEWFKELLSNQKTIKIFNRYAYTTDEFKIMIQFIIKQVDDCSNIHIYIDQENAGTPKDDIIKRNRLLKQLSESKHMDIRVYSYQNGGTSYHDRRMFLDISDIRFSEGFGCLLAGTDLRKLKQGHYLISHNYCDVENEIQSLFRQHPGYIEIWDVSKEPDNIDM